MDLWTHKVQRLNLPRLVFLVIRHCAKLPAGSNRSKNQSSHWTAAACVRRYSTFAIEQIWPVHLSAANRLQPATNWIAVKGGASFHRQSQNYLVPVQAFPAFSTTHLQNTLRCCRWVFGRFYCTTYHAPFSENCKCQSGFPVFTPPVHAGGTGLVPRSLGDKF